MGCQGKIPQVLFCLWLIVFLSFGPALSASFLNWDDDTHVYENPLVRSLDFQNIKRIFQTTINDTYIPLTVLSLTLEHYFVGLKPFVYHLNNLLLHGGVVALVLILGLRCGLSLRAAGVAALLFGVHPMHVESVVWVTERKDVLYAFFYLLSLIQYHSYTQTQRWRDFLLSLLWGFLSVLAKPMALSLPLVLFLCDALWQRRWTAHILWKKIPFLVLMGPVVWITYSLHTRVPVGHLPESALIWIWTFAFYPVKFLWPWELTAYYVLPKPVAITQPHYALALGVLCLAVFLLIRLRRYKWPIFSLGFYFASIFFLLRFDDLRDTNIVADRFMYLPSLGFCFLAGWLGDQALIHWKQIPSRGFAYAALVLILLSLFVKTHLQSRVWKDNLTFWNYVISKNDKIPRAHNHRGVAWVESGQRDRALRDFTWAIELYPNYTKAYCNRAETYALEGETDLALQDLNWVLGIDPNLARGYSIRGLIYSKRGDYDLSIRDFTKALELNPQSYKDYNNRGVTYKKRGDFALAIQDYTQAITLNPGSYEAYINRANLYLLTHQKDFAAADFAQARRLQQRDSQPAR